MTRARIGMLTLAVFVAGSALSYFSQESEPHALDSDSHYHLAMAQLLAREGLPLELDGLRFSALAESFADPHILFHIFLAPLATTSEPFRLNLALFQGGILALITALALKAGGWWGLALAPILVLGSRSFVTESSTLGPDLLALPLSLLAFWAAARGHYRRTGLLVALVALCHPQVTILLAILFLFFLVQGWSGRGWHWPLLLFTILGAGLGWVVHPGFPANVLAAKILGLAGLLPLHTDALILANLGFWMAMLALWLSLAPLEDDREEKEGPADLPRLLSLGTLLYALLTLLVARRFAVYFFPLAGIWIFWQAWDRDLRPSPTIRTPGPRTLPLAAALALSALLGGLGWLRAESPRPNTGMVELREWATAVPIGAHVAAGWEITPLLLRWAPQGRYLNALHPDLMAHPEPLRYQKERDVFLGREPDIPLTAWQKLDSRYLVTSLVHDSPRVFQRLRDDPRASLLHGGALSLFQLLPPGPDSFVLAWYRTPDTGTTNGGPLDEPVKLQPYPRLLPARGRSWEAYVDVRRFGPGRICTSLIHELTLEHEELVEYELAPYGPATLWVDGKRVAESRSELGAVLGQGLRFSLQLAPGNHVFQIRSCPARSAPHNGFYLLKRSVSPAPLTGPLLAPPFPSR